MGMTPTFALQKKQRITLARGLDVNANARFHAVLERARETNAYWVEKANIDCTEEIAARMDESKEYPLKSDEVRRRGHVI